MKNKLFLYFFILIIVIVSIVSISIAFSSKEENVLDKTIDEIDFLENKIINIMNSLNNINYTNYKLEEEKRTTSGEESQAKSESGESGGNSQKSSGGESQEQKGENSGEQSNNDKNSKTQIFYNLKSTSILLNTNKEPEINWDYIKSNTEMIYSRWATIVLDLHELNVSNETILNFTTVLDQVVVNEKNEDKVNVMIYLAQLYSILTDYRKQISDDNRNINLDYTKSFILNSYSLVEQDKWNDANLQLDNAISSYLKIMNSVDIKEQTQNRVNKVYVLLNELKNSLNLNDKDLYHIKYKNIMEEIVNL